MTSALRRCLPLALVTLVALSFSSCAALNQVAGRLLSPPKVTYLGADLVRAPSQLDLSAYYCGRMLGKSVGIAVAADLVCGKLFGRTPKTEDMQVGFDLRFEVENPNQIPLPLSEILSAIQVFPGQNQQNLGAVCLSLCAPGDANCLGGASTTGCKDAPGDVKSLEDFPQAAARVLIAQGIAAAGGKPAGFSLPKVTANARLPVTARLAITPEALLPAMEELARRSVGDIKAGKPLAFEIPYKLEGTVFADAGTLGRVAAAFGPTSGSWPLPTERLLPQ